MSANDFESKPSHEPGGSRKAVLILGAGLALALGLDAYQFAKAEHKAKDAEAVERSLQNQITKLSDATSSAFDVDQQRFNELKTALDNASTTALRQAQSEAKRSSSQVARALERKQQEVANQLSDLKQQTDTKLQDTSSKLEDTNTKLDTTNSKLDQVSSDTERNGSDLKRMVGDLGVMSGDIATNGKELAALKELGERNYFEFDLTKVKDGQKVGDIRISLKKSDPKHSRFTLNVMADDKIVEKRDRTINEPVQLYVSGSRQPYEIVVNQVKKNEVIGYLSTPKVKTPRGKGVSASL